MDVKPDEKNVNTNACGGNCADPNCCVEEVGDLVKKLVRIFQLFERDQIKVFGVTTSQCYCLLELLSLHSPTMYELSQKLNLNTSTVTRLVDNLVRDKLVERDRDESDRRIIKLRLTLKGRDKALNLNDSIVKYYRQIIRSIPDGELFPILESVSKLLTAFEAANPRCC